MGPETCSVATLLTQGWSLIPRPAKIWGLLSMYSMWSEHSLFFFSQENQNIVLQRSEDIIPAHITPDCGYLARVSLALACINLFSIGGVAPWWYASHFIACAISFFVFIKMWFYLHHPMHSVLCLCFACLYDLWIYIACKDQQIALGTSEAWYIWKCSYLKGRAVTALLIQIPSCA